MKTISFRGASSMLGLCIALLGASCAPLPLVVRGTISSRGQVSAGDGRWVWIPVPGMRCGNGTTTGIAINRSRRSRTWVIYLEGGGACWNAANCFGLLPTALNLGGFGFADLKHDRNLTSPLLRREARNPLQDASYVVVPYCTGDLHAGQRVAEYRDGDKLVSMHHVGRANLEATLEAIRRASAQADRVLLVGGSAGGMGAFMSLPLVQSAYPHARVDVVDDSGPPIQPGRDRLADWLFAWDMQPPAGCGECDTRLDAWVDFYAAKYSKNRIAILSFNRDAVFSAFGGVSSTALESALTDLSLRMKPSPFHRLFIADGFLHMVLPDPLARAGGLSGMEWIGQMVKGQGDWKPAD